jgi:hypothetical protein
MVTQTNQPSIVRWVRALADAYFGAGSYVVLNGAALFIAQRT